MENEGVTKQKDAKNKMKNEDVTKQSNPDQDGSRQSHPPQGRSGTGRHKPWFFLHLDILNIFLI